MADEPSDTGLDIDKTVDAIGKDLFPVEESADAGQTEEATPEEQATAETPSPEPAALPVPKSWPKDMHEHWAKVPPNVQEYWGRREKQMLDGLDQYKGDAAYGKSLREVMLPYQPILHAAGMTETQAVQTLLNAHYRLTQGSPESRAAAYRELGKNLGLVADKDGETPTDPAVKALIDRLSGLEQTITTRDQAAYQEAHDKITKEVDAFASDQAHPYFDEVADDIVGMIRAGYPLQDAYDKAIWANPVTRQKEIARLQTETEKKQKENARLEALKAKTAMSANVRSRDSSRTPTEPPGTMEDTIRSTLAELRSRAH